jgi:flagellar biosynthesis protein FlhG
VSDSPLFQRRGHDQAHDLRVLVAGRRGADQPPRVTESTRVVAVTSGKGGVGKTSLTVNLAVTLARLGKQVIILDCDLGTANVDVMLGMHPRYSLQHVLSRQHTLEEVMSTGPHGIRVISGGSGFSELANLSDSRRDELLSAFAALDGQADVLLLDTGAGISANVLRFVVAAGEAIVVTTPEPTAVTDAYALIKVVTQQARGGALPTGSHDPASDLRLRLVVNQATSPAEAQETATNIVTVARRFLGVEIEHFGSIPADRAMSQAVRQQTAAVDAFPRTPATAAIQDLAHRLLNGEAAPVPPPAVETPSALTVGQALAQDGAIPVPAANGRHPGGLGTFIQRFFGARPGRMAS